MSLTRQDLERIVEKALPGFTIVDQPIADAPDSFVPAEASAPSFAKLQEKLGSSEGVQPRALTEVEPDDVTTFTVRSPDNPLQPAAGSQLKYIQVSNKTGKVVAIQG
jgi:hypothetical protein